MDHPFKLINKKLNRIHIRMYIIPGQKLKSYISTKKTPPHPLSLVDASIKINIKIISHLHTSFAKSHCK